MGEGGKSELSTFPSRKGSLMERLTVRGHGGILKGDLELLAPEKA